MLFDFVPVSDCGRFLITSGTASVPFASQLLSGTTFAVVIKINLANSTSRNSVCHLSVSVAGASDPVYVHDNRSVDLECADSQSSISNGVVSSVRLHGDQSRDQRSEVHLVPFIQAAALTW
jgi:hypothetical protein